MKYICEVVPMAFLVLHYQFPPGKPTEMPSHHRAHETHAGALLIPLGRGPRALNVARFLIFTPRTKHTAVGADPGVPRCAGPMKSKLSASLDA